MKKEDVRDLIVFQAVAEEQSFTRAAARVGLTQPTLSQIVSDLEQRMGVKLIARTTRSVRTTEAGQRLLETIQPAFSQISDQMKALADSGDTPSGKLRLTTTKHPALSMLLPALTVFGERHPGVKVEIVVDDAFTDIIAGGFDAGIRFGEHLEKDMIRVPIGPDVRAAVVASPDYVARHGTPHAPKELTFHNCINFLMPSLGGVFRWRFWENGRPFEVKVEGALTVNDGDVLVAAAAGGQGMAYIFEDHVYDLLASGRLVRCLEDWCPPFPGYYLYYPDRKQKTPALAALIDIISYRAAARKATKPYPAHSDEHQDGRSPA